MGFSNIVKIKNTKTRRDLSESLEIPYWTYAVVREYAKDVFGIRLSKYWHVGSWFSSVLSLLSKVELSEPNLKIKCKKQKLIT